MDGNGLGANPIHPMLYRQRELRFPGELALESTQGS